MCGVETWNMNINSNLSLVENFIRDVQNGRDEFHLSFDMNQVHGLLELRWHFIRCLFETFNQTGAILFIVYSPFLKYLFVFRIVKWKTFCFLTFFYYNRIIIYFVQLWGKKISSNLFEKKKIFTELTKLLHFNRKRKRHVFNVKRFCNDLCI